MQQRALSRKRSTPRVRTARRSAYQAGRRDGWREGWSIGWREGAAAAAAAVFPPAAPERLPIRVLYVPQGFESIDDGMIGALQLHAAELHVADPTRMAEMAALIRPDLVLVLNGLHVFPDDHLEQVDRIREMGIRTAVWFADDPYVTEQTVAIAPHYDVVVTHERSTVELYRSLGCPEVHHLAFAADIERFRPVTPPAAYRCDVCFIGQAFWNRVETFDAIAEELADLNVFIAGGLWERLKSYGLLKRAIRPGWLPVDESVLYYNGAKIVINLHRTAEPGSDNANASGLPGLSVNPRTFEIAACGAFQLTDRREDLEAYYRPGLELETFDSPAELAAKIRHYLKHDDERRRIAVRGLARTLREHTYTARAGSLLRLLGYGG
ncbi:Spore maturation protein [Thermobacillus xylanilyticus]|jgi:spore maturation protein CgeB|uniref:Spore maturation protein n=1 Tax=Thermobacillus xylanilyticus TaxID=76633 RepID=A0ABN7S8Z4_THEXY|nr:glycosyltransferase [Thermobacillus xylanilyticus]REJ17035.1 MAG: spore maturation protein [Paenibacillaceae bacterium]CAG5090743.1 Spore maturation protein [Thermobacillus xylanilyticus]